MNWAIKHRSLAAVFVASLCFIIPLAVLTSTLSFRLNTDYDVALPMAQFAINAFTKPSSFLVWNPYIGLGIPVLGDPSSWVFSPFYMPFFVIFGADVGLRIIIAATVIVSGMTMWLFLRSYKLHPWTAAWGAIVYELSGAVAAMISSGHIEEFVRYALTPIVFLFLLRKKMSIKDAAITGIIFACFYLSDDFYGPWLLGIFYLTAAGYRLLTQSDSLKNIVKEIGVITGFFLAYSSPKLVLFIRDILPHFNRLATINPYLGSIHAFLLPIPYIIPWQVSFYDRPTLERILHFHFNWYEYYAFISPFALVPLLFIRRVVKKYEIKLILLFILVSALYISLAYPYSPFYWLFHLLPAVRMFRVPQRIVVTLLVPLLLLIGFCIDEVFHGTHNMTRKIVVISMLISVLWVFLVTFQTALGSFEPIRQNEKSVAQQLRRRDSTNFYVVTFTCCMQTFLSQQSIPILNYYYGWRPTHAPTFANTAGDAYDFSELSYIRPSYIIANRQMVFEKYNYQPYFGSGDIEVWKTELPTIFPSL